MRVHQAVDKILRAVTEGIPGRKPSTVIKDELLRAHDAGVETMRRRLIEDIGRAIRHERASASDEVWGERRNEEAASVRIAQLQAILDGLGRVALSARKVGASVVCDKCGEDIDPAKDSTCPHCKAFLWRPL